MIQAEASRRRALRWICILVAVSVSACDSGSGSESGSEFTSADSSAILITTSPRPSAEWTLGAPIVEIGDVDGDPAYELYRVRDVLRLPDGRIVVLDFNSQIRFYDPHGRHMRTVGRRGGGPGEYQITSSVLLMGDSLWILDGLRGRISILDMQGHFVRSFALEPTGDPDRQLLLYEMAGTISDSIFVLTPWGFPASTRGEARVHWEVVNNLLYSREGVLLGTFGPPRGVEMEVRTTPVRSSGAAPFGRRSAVALGDSLLYHSDAEHLEFRAYDLENRLRRILRLEHTPRAITADRKRDVLRVFDEPSEDAAYMRDRHQAADLPDREPAHGGRMVVSEEGHLWIEEYVYHWERDVPGWFLVDREGRWIATVRPPVRLDIRQVGPWGVLGVWRVRWGVERVGIWPLVQGD